MVAIRTRRGYRSAGAVVLCGFTSECRSRNWSDSNRCRPGAKCDCVGADNATGWLAGWLAGWKPDPESLDSRPSGKRCRPNELAMLDAACTDNRARVRSASLPAPPATRPPNQPLYLLGHLAVALLRLALALTRFRRPYRPAPPRFLCACIYAAILCWRLGERCSSDAGNWPSLNMLAHCMYLYVYIYIPYITQIHLLHSFGGTANNWLRPCARNCCPCATAEQIENSAFAFSFLALCPKWLTICLQLCGLSSPTELYLLWIAVVCSVFWHSGILAHLGWIHGGRTRRMCNLRCVRGKCLRGVLKGGVCEPQRNHKHKYPALLKRRKLLTHVVGTHLHKCVHREK